MSIGGGYYLKSSAICVLDFRNDLYLLPLGLGLGKVFRFGSAIANANFEPQFAVYHNGQGLPTVQLVFGLGLQWKKANSWSPALFLVRGLLAVWPVRLIRSLNTFHREFMRGIQKIANPLGPPIKSLTSGGPFFLPGEVGISNLGAVAELFAVYHGCDLFSGFGIHEFHFHRNLADVDRAIERVT